MNLKIILVTVILISSSFAALEEILPVTIDPLDHQDLTPLDFAELITNAQPEIIKKSVQHFLAEKIRELIKTKSSSAIKEQIANWFSPEETETISHQIVAFIKERLFNRLEMISLSNSFKNEIENQPEDYFLTYDMYDLLIDE